MLPNEITPFDVGGGYAYAGGVHAYLYVDFDKSIDNSQVRLNRVYGSWTPTSYLYSLTNREIMAHSGTPYGKKLEEKPTSNTFSYTTGWGFNPRVWGNASPRAMSDAIIHIEGMGGTHAIHVEFTYS